MTTVTKTLFILVSSQSQNLIFQFETLPNIDKFIDSPVDTFHDSGQSIKHDPVTDPSTV